MTLKVTETIKDGGSREIAPGRDSDHELMGLGKGQKVFLRVLQRLLLSLAKTNGNSCHGECPWQRSSEYVVGDRISTVRSGSPT